MKTKKDKKRTYYVYELLNSEGSIEYIGRTTLPKKRMWQHTKQRPIKGYGMGKFYGRTDLIMNILQTFDVSTHASHYETELKIKNGIPPTEKINSTNNALKNFSVERIPVYAYTRDGEYVGEFVSQDDCSKKLNLTKSAVSYVVSGKIKHTKGYIIIRKRVS